MHYQSLTAYPNSEQNCRQNLVRAEIDLGSFKRKIQQCSLTVCRGMCCYDGVLLTEEDAEIVRDIAAQNTSFFTNLGLQLPDRVIIDYPNYEKYDVVNCEWHGVSGSQVTAVKEAKFSSLLDSFPESFDNTACIFLTDRGKCGLQMLSEARGLHPWYYKPFTCWLHPIMLIPLTNNNILIQLPNEENQPQWGGAIFTTHTICGKTHELGEPAYLILEEELKFLSAIVGRNFEDEVKRNFT